MCVKTGKCCTFVCCGTSVDLTEELPNTPTIIWAAQWHSLCWNVASWACQTSYYNSVAACVQGAKCTTWYTRPQNKPFVEWKIQLLSHFWLCSAKDAFSKPLQTRLLLKVDLIFNLWAATWWGSLGLAALDYSVTRKSGVWWRFTAPCAAQWMETVPFYDVPVFRMVMSPYAHKPTRERFHKKTRSRVIDGLSHHQMLLQLIVTESWRWKDISFKDGVRNQCPVDKWQQSACLLFLSNCFYVV